jgi:hypothetical protein
MISWRQSLEQPSPLTPLPSSHSSVAASLPSPHDEAQVVDVGAKHVSDSPPRYWKK